MGPFEITRIDDLREVSFNDFFYAIYSSTDKTAAATALSQLFYAPDCFAEMQHIIAPAFERYSEVFNKNKGRSYEPSQSEVEEEAQRAADRLSHIGSMKISVHRNFFLDDYERRSEIVDRIKREKHQKARQKLMEAARSFSHAIRQCKELDSSGVLAEVEATTKDLLQENGLQLGASIVELIPKSNNATAQKLSLATKTLAQLECDIDLIVHFGLTFHKTFSELDAYTGLAYSYSYFGLDK